MPGLGSPFSPRQENNYLSPRGRERAFFRTFGFSMVGQLIVWTVIFVINLFVNADTLQSIGVFSPAAISIIDSGLKVLKAAITIPFLAVYFTAMFNDQLLSAGIAEIKNYLPLPLGEGWGEGRKITSLSLWERVGVRVFSLIFVNLWVYPLPGPLPEGEGIKNGSPRVRIKMYLPEGGEKKMESPEGG